MHPRGLDDALRQVGDRWSLVIIDALRSGPKTFSDVRDGIDDIAPTTLTQRLRRLEDDGLVVARPYSTRPPRSLYELTSAGARLVPVIEALQAWSADATGSPLPSGPWTCPVCGARSDERDDEEFVDDV